MLRVPLQIITKRKMIDSALNVHKLTLRLCQIGATVQAVCFEIGLDSRQFLASHHRRASRLVTRTVLLVALVLGDRVPYDKHAA